jgi:Xaa-Pro dipeptidase
MLLNRARAENIMAQEGLDGLIATTPENVTYLTDHHGDHWFIHTITVLAVLAKDKPKPVLIAPITSITALTSKDIDVRAFGELIFIKSNHFEPDEYDQALLEKRKELGSAASPNAMQALFKTVRDLGLTNRRVAVDECNFTRNQFAALEAEFPKAKFVDGYDLFFRLRAVKTEEEIERLRTSVKATEAGLRAAEDILTPGVTEKELQLAYHLGVVKAGGLPLFTIVCSGQRSAHTNTVPGDRVIQPGDVIRFDIGSVYRYYKSDIARTFVAGGEPNETQQCYWNAVVAAEEAAMQAMKPGVTAGEVFRIAVQTAREAGIPNFKRNHVGHGIGIETYDQPILTPDNPAVIEEGMVFCIEPPYNEFGVGGFQVEDTVVVRKNGVELLSTYHKNLAPHPKR